MIHHTIIHIFIAYTSSLIRPSRYGHKYTLCTGRGCLWPNLSVQMFLQRGERGVQLPRWWCIRIEIFYSHLKYTHLYLYSIHHSNINIEFIMFWLSRHLNFCFSWMLNKLIWNITIFSLGGGFSWLDLRQWLWFWHHLRLGEWNAWKVNRVFPYVTSKP